MRRRESLRMFTKLRKVFTGSWGAGVRYGNYKEKVIPNTVWRKQVTSLEDKTYVLQILHITRTQVLYRQKSGRQWIACFILVKHFKSRPKLMWTQRYIKSHAKIRKEQNSWKRILPVVVTWSKASLFGSCDLCSGRSRVHLTHSPLQWSLWPKTHGIIVYLEQPFSTFSTLEINFPVSGNSC